MATEAIGGAIIFPGKDEDGNDIVRAAGDNISVPIVHPPGASGVSVAIDTDQDVNVELLPEIDGIFRGAAVTNAALTANRPELITTFPFKVARFKVNIVTTTDTIFSAEVHSLRS